jgi:membrane glycosyltransferase
MKSARSPGKPCARSYEINRNLSLSPAADRAASLTRYACALLLVALPLLSIPMTVLTSKVGVGTAMRTHNYLLIPQETKSPAVLRRAWQPASQLAKPRLKAALVA